MLFHCRNFLPLLNLSATKRPNAFLLLYRDVSKPPPRTHANLLADIVKSKNGTSQATTRLTLQIPYLDCTSHEIISRKVTYSAPAMISAWSTPGNGLFTTTLTKASHFPTTSSTSSLPLATRLLMTDDFPIVPAIITVLAFDEECNVGPVNDCWAARVYCLS